MAQGRKLLDLLQLNVMHIIMTHKLDLSKQVLFPLSVLTWTWAGGKWGSQLSLSLVHKWFLLLTSRSYGESSKYGLYCTYGSLWGRPHLVSFQLTAASMASNLTSWNDVSETVDNSCWPVYFCEGTACLVLLWYFSNACTVCKSYKSSV